MKKLSKKTVLLIIVLVVVVISTVSCTSYLVNSFIDDRRKDAGLTIKSVNIPGFKIVYAEGGTGETVIMIHGFGLNKDAWLAVAKYLTPNYRVIIPDLPGFGESSKPQNANYSIMSEVERVNLFAKELKLTKFHLIGQSMGGNISGNYAATYPDMVRSLALIDAVGVNFPIKNEFALLYEKGINSLIIKEVDDYDKILKIVFVKPPEYPSFIKKYIAKREMKAGPFYEKIDNDMRADGLVLETKLNRITAPTLIVWGDSDKIIDISSVGIFEKNIKNSKSVIIKDCGHAPMMEKPDQTALAYQDFLKGIK